MTNFYHKFVAEHARLLRETSNARPVKNPAPARHVTPTKNAPQALIFAPHPDDECIIGALPLRLLRELKMRVADVAVTLGSRKDRRQERWQELNNACESLGFEVILPKEGGMEKINLDGRRQMPENWQACVKIIAQLLETRRPRVIFIPHAGDWNSTHIGVNALLNDALAALGNQFCCWVCETEYWMPMDTPNLLVESTITDVADLIAALACHVGEVQRNPYHLRLPAWMIDNVRRGGELVGGQGGEAPQFSFATLYRLRKWAHGRYEETPAGKFIAAGESLENLFG